MNDLSLRCQVLIWSLIKQKCFSSEPPQLSFIHPWFNINPLLHRRHAIQIITANSGQTQESCCLRCCCMCVRMIFAKTKSNFQPNFPGLYFDGCASEELPSAPLLLHLYIFREQIVRQWRPHNILRNGTIVQELCAPRKGSKRPSILCKQHSIHTASERAPRRVLCTGGGGDKYI